MVTESRIAIYNYLYDLFYNVVTKNVYSMREPQELTTSDTTDGFIVIRVGTITDASEFDRETYARVRCYIQAFVPPISRGRLDYKKYKLFEDSILAVIHEAEANPTDDYFIEEDSLISSDTEETENANNSYYTFIKSFLITIDKHQ